jgi:hypothetical protein
MTPLGAILFTIYCWHPAVNIETGYRNNTETNAHTTRSIQHTLKRKKLNHKHIQEEETYTKSEN